MTRVILPMILLVLFSCEMHTQETKTPPKVEAKVIDLNSIDSLVTSLLQDDYFMAQSILEENNLEINIANDQGKVLLNEAIKLDRLLIGELLVKFGARMDTLDEFGDSASDLIQRSEEINEWKLVLDGQSVTKEFVVKRALKKVSEMAIDDQQKNIEILSLYLEKEMDLNYISDNKQTLLMIAASKNLLKIVEHLCSYDELDPNLTVTILRRRREYQVSAMFYATTQDMKDALYRCGHQ